MSETSSTIQIKGIRDGLLVTLDGSSWQEIAADFVKNVDERASFFQGAHVTLDVGPNELRVAELSSLRNQLSDRGISLWAVLSSSPITEKTAQNLGLATRISKPQPVKVREEIEVSRDAAKWIKGPLRSGTHVAYDGNIVVLGDVNPGAVIEAGGSVIVWGRLRGVVHAGAQGDEGAVVCALELSPTQLRIASGIAVSPKKQGKIAPEVARMKDGNLLAEPWQELTGR